ncbi:MAG: flavodoxin-dependent (E)-4-hydroxy-3-methylbut-2-enyl-diphosphate synthase, partial [Armatimonadetes bacterium]|nr:flavodoxin-dependent (E)-4-hydroxy-3-methylbut-2-enyl-diphosphate synthase [Armatimonadota bacterium]
MTDRTKNPHRELAMEFPRWRTRPVRIGNVVIGGDHPVVVQSMITENTRDVDACVASIRRMHRAGCEIVRVTAPTLQDAHAIGRIRAELGRRGEPVALVADVHHEGARIAIEVAMHVDKVRINPGLFVFRKRREGLEWTPEECEAHRAQIERELLPVLEACAEHGTALRIGVNHGSLSDRMLTTYGDTPEGMVESALEFIRICAAHDFREIVISLKASREPVMIQANRLMVR